MKTDGKARRLAIGLTVACLALAGCSGGDEAPKKADKISQAPQADKQPVLKTDSPEAPQNRPLREDLPAVPMGDLSAYKNIITPVAPLRYYTAYRGWDESNEEVLEAVTDSISPAVKRDNPALYAAGYDYISAQDAFKKHDAANEVIKLVQQEGASVAGRRLVRIDTLAQLDSYNFSTKGFGVSSCFFSDKEYYSDNEMKSPQAMARAAKPRCLMATGMTNYAVGMIGGSKVSFPVSDEGLARKIEAAKDSTHLVVYGYVGSVQRERLGGRLFKKRFVMVIPQRVDLVENKTDEVLLSQIL
ncbi:hypothetical protein [Pseudomonas sp. RIT-To-2]|uniref:hypothetical protein n=1 Tax=Pseudomonas sp. RIT-To-2 TaxID=3462541 RepID=UPI0024134F08